MTSVLKKSRGTKGKSISMQEDLPAGYVSQADKPQESSKLVVYIDENVIGKGTSFCGPYGRRKVVYCDYSGSGRALHFLEEHVARDVLPTHATPSTPTSYASLQSALYRSEAQSIVRAAVGACAEDVVLLGASPARLVRALRPQGVTLFVSARETERQLAPWRECDALITKIPESKEGFLDLNALELRLQDNSGTGRRLVGFFPAASKLTGVMADDVATTLLLHQYGAWAFWDYTLVAPSAAVDMNPTFLGMEDEMVKKDAVFFNCEKFVGGVQAPFVAVVKKDVFNDTPPFSNDIEMVRERLEEGGCAQAARAALVLQLRDAVGLQHIAQRQDKITKQVLAHIKNIPELILLGNESPTVRRLPIFSLLVKHPRGTFLHHNFVCAVLNDVFGIQARGGLNGDLSYGQDVLGIDAQLLREYEKLLDVDLQKEIAKTKKSIDSKYDLPVHNEHLRPGFCRISLPFFMSESEVAFVLEALKMVATEGWKIMPQYVVDPFNGQWKHHTNAVFRDRKSLFSLRFNDGQMTSNERKISGPGIFPQTYTESLQTARNLFNRARKLAMKCSIAEQEVTFNPRIDYLRWFMLPKEAHDLLLGRSANVKHIVPFDPSGYTGARKSLNMSCNRSSISCSPILGSSARHYSLSAIDDCQLIRFKQKQKFFSRETSLLENHQEQFVNTEADKSPPVKFAVGDSVSPLRLSTDLSINNSPKMMRSRCYSLGSDSPPPALSPQTRLNLGLKEASPNNVTEKSNFCHCGSQTDLQSLDDPMISPSKPFPYSTQSSGSMSDCSHAGRISPTVSITSHTSEDLHAYVKEMTRELATEIKSEIREVISQVDDILENSDSLELSNASMNSYSSHSEHNSVSVIDVAEYLMEMSKEITSEVTHEIREMVSQVDGMMCPEMLSGSGSYLNSVRKCSPPHAMRRRIGSGPELGLDLKKSAYQSLKKCSTSPVLPIDLLDDENKSYNRSPVKSSAGSPKSAQGTPLHEASGPNSISFNSSETSTPETIIQVVTTSLDSPPSTKSISAHKLSDEEICCSETLCRQFCNKKTWCQNPSISSQDSGINMSFQETDSYQDFVKLRTSSDPTTNKGRNLYGRLRVCQRHEKSEVPDIIEGVPVCAGDHARQYAKCFNQGGDSRVAFQLHSETDSRGSNRTSRSSNASSGCSEHTDCTRSSGYSTDNHDTRQRLQRPQEYDDLRDVEESFKAEGLSDEISESSSAGTDSSITDFTYDDEGKWHCPPKAIWKSTVEAIQEFGMIRHQDKVLVCLSGGRESLALLHTIHQYQFYARAKGTHFSIGAIFVHDPASEVDPLHLMAYCRTLGVKFIYQDKADAGLVDKHSEKTGEPSACHRWASHGVRRRVYAAAAAHGYAVAALAQHLDHAARAFLAAAFHAGALRSVKAHYRVGEHDLRIIRPFIYVREKDLDQFSQSRMLPDFRGDAKMAALKCYCDNEVPSSPEHRESPERQIESPEHSDGSCFNSSKHLRDRSISEPGSQDKVKQELCQRGRSASAPMELARDILMYHEHIYPCLFSSLKDALHPLISAKNLDKDLKEHRHRKKSVIQMKNGSPVYDSDEGTDEEPVP